MADPDVLYHYTTTEGLLGIVQSRTLWATNAEFLNDAQELRFGRREIYQALMAEADRLSPAGRESGDALGSRATVMRSAAAQLDVRGQYHVVYVACFCEEGDLLSQWRAYGSAGGYAVGFRVADLRSAEPAEAGRSGGVVASPVNLVQVRYGDDAREDAVAQVLRTIAPDPVGHPGTQGYVRAQTIVLPALAGIKHPAFREEREWRLVLVTDQHEPSFRSGALGVAPYISLRYPTVAAADVVVGPGREQRLREQGVKLLVGENVSVRSSAAPFRG
jgi:hypothetical protein